MANIYPQWLPESKRNDPKYDAEVAVYDALATLGDRWTVLYHSLIKWRHQHGVSDREADFIVAHPSLGVLMLEVKGGAISREGTQWYTTPRSERRKPIEARRRFPIKNPFEQATDAAYRYYRKVRSYASSHHLPEPGFRIATGVCFPHITVSPDFYLGAEALRPLTIDREDLKDVKEAVYGILHAHRGEDHAEPGEQAIELLVDVLAPTWHIDSFMVYQYESAEERRQALLTDEQYRFLYSLGENRRLLVTGCAGSGKTFLAAEKARQMADLGKRVLLTCYTPNLASWLKGTQYDRPSMMIESFHRFCHQMASASSEVNLPRWSSESAIDEETYFDVMMPDALELAAADLDVCFDAIIVDECQDFHAAWLGTLMNLLADKNLGIFYIFYDDNQNIFDKNPKLDFPFQGPVYSLTRNLRNTNEIHNTTKRYHHRPDAILPSGIHGPPPQFVATEDHGDEQAAVQHVLEYLGRERIPSGWIVVLTPRSEENSRWKPKEIRWGQFVPVWDLEPRESQVSCCTIHSFKGLERPAVVLTEIDHLPFDAVGRNRLLYTACSRAKTHLIVVGDERHLDVVRRESI